jgi:hypothetical protein
MDDPIQPKVNQSDDVTIAVEAPRAGASAAALSPSPHVEARIAHETRGSKDGGNDHKMFSVANER